MAQERFEGLVLVCFLAIGVAARVNAQSPAEYRSNIGKTALNATNGVEIRRIVDVAQMSGVWVYRVTREGRIITSPVANVVVKSVPSTAALDPAALPASGIDPSIRPTATEFDRRLMRNGGRVHALTLKNGSLSARWTSASAITSNLRSSIFFSVSTER